MRPKVLLVQTINQAGIDLLAKEAEVTIASSPDFEQIKQEIKDYDAVIVRSSEFPAGLITAGTKLKVIGRHGVGYENIDIAAAAKRNIPVVYAPGSNTMSVAEHAVGLMLAVTKKIVDADERLRRQGDYQYRWAVKTTELTGKTLGIIGFGKIGKKVAEICKNGFKMNVIAYDKYISPQVAEENGATLVDDLNALLEQADIVSLHVAGGEETYHLIGMAELQKMKPSAFLINTCRGTVLDEQALLHALQEKMIAGAGLDVLDPEPPAIDNPLYGFNNVVLTPHVAAHSEEALILMATWVAQGVLDVLNGKKPSFVANASLLKV